MNIFEYARNMEKEGETFYRKQAENCSDKGLAVILNMLADDEVKHFDILQAMEKTAAAEMTNTAILGHAKNIFAKINPDEWDIKGNITQLDLYRKAQQMEKKSEDFYREHAAKEANETNKALLNQIAEEEKKHFLLLQNIIDLVSRPRQWIENAEFNHLEDY